MAAYDRAMAALPRPQQVRDVRTGYGIVRVYRFAGAHDDLPPLLLLPGRAAPTPVWADNLTGFLALRSVYTIDLLGEPVGVLVDVDVQERRACVDLLESELPSRPCTSSGCLSAAGRR
jgi:hypothetical protein